MRKCGAASAKLTLLWTAEGAVWEAACRRLILGMFASCLLGEEVLASDVKA